MPATVQCPIWDTQAQRILESDQGDFDAVDSPRAGGKYRITGSARSVLENWNVQDKKLLTSWLVAQRKGGISVPEITTQVLDAMKLRPLLRFSQKIDAALILLSQATTLDTQYVLQQVPDKKAMMLMAVTETESPGELRHLFVLMKDMGLLDARLTQAAGAFWIAAKGWERIDDLTYRTPSSPQAFVAMWFHQTTDDAYKDGIAPAIEANGFLPVRIDAKQHVNRIDDEIIAEIRKSTFVVADFTCAKGQVRGGVYYEAGFAMGLRIPVIWTCKETSN